MVTKEQAMTAGHFYHKDYKYKDGSPKVFVRSGKCKTWKTKPNIFILYVRHGMFKDQDHYQISDQNAHEWYVSIDDMEADTPIPVTLKEIIESSPVHAERITAFANHWADSRVFPVVLLNYLVDECGAEHPEWDLKPLLARLQWFVEMHPRRILMPYINMGESDKECPVYPMTLSNQDHDQIEMWQIRISPTPSRDPYFIEDRSGSAHTIPYDVTTVMSSTVLQSSTPGECFFKLFMEM